MDKVRITVVWMTVAAVSACGQTPAKTKPAATNPQTTKKAPAEPSLRETILERAHSALGPLTPDERSNLLSNLVGVAAEWHSPRARDWAEELFKAANGLSKDPRRRAQYAAVNVMTQADLTRAAAMLEQMDPDPPRDDDNGKFEPQLRQLAAQRLIEVVWGKYKDAGVPVIRELTAQLASSGGYPYSAVSMVITQMGARNPEITEILFRDALAAYRQSSSARADADFHGFLAPITHLVATASLKEGFDLLVQKILQHGDSTVVQFSGGGSLSEGEMRLRGLLPLLRNTDPELAQEITRDHPNLARVSGTPMSQPRMRPRTPEQTADLQRMQELDRGAKLLNQSGDPKMLAQAMPDVETRAMVFAQAAQGDVNRDVAKARAELQQAFSLANQLDDSRARLRALSSIAWSADAVGDQGIRRQVIEEAFPIAERLVRDEFDDEGHYKPGDASEALHRLVQLGMETDPEATLARIDQVSIPELRAALLIGAANAALPEKKAAKQ